MKKTTIAATAAAFLICGSFTGCGCMAEESSTTNSTTTTTTTASTTKSTATTDGSATTNTTVTTTTDDNSLVGDITGAVDSVVDGVTSILTDATKPVGTE